MTVTNVTGLKRGTEMLPKGYYGKKLGQAVGI